MNDPNHLAIGLVPVANGREVPPLKGNTLFEDPTLRFKKKRLLKAGQPCLCDCHADRTWVIGGFE